MTATAITLVQPPAGGDSFANDGQKWLLVQHTNGAGTDVALTVETTFTYSGIELNDLTLTIAAGEMYILSGFTKAYFNDDERQVQFSVDDNTDILVAILDVSGGDSSWAS